MADFRDLMAAANAADDLARQTMSELDNMDEFMETGRDDLAARAGSRALVLSNLAIAWATREAAIRNEINVREAATLSVRSDR